MKNYPCIFLLILFVIIISCESENIEEKYLLNGSLPPVDKPLDEIAWFPLNGNLNDSSGNITPILLVGDVNYVDGLNEKYGKGIYLNGSSYLLLNLGFYDTLSVVFWLKGDGEIGDFSQPALFDYGQNAISTYLDGSSGATMLKVHKNDSTISSVDASVEFLNSYTKYSFLYFEAGSNLTRIYFKGYAMDGSEVIYKEDIDLPGSILTESENLYIGRSSLRENQIGSFFQGAIDEIHIYCRPLTDSEIETFAFIQTN